MHHTKAELLDLTAENLATLSESQVDEYFADLYDREYDVDQAENRAWDRLYYYAGISHKTTNHGRRSTGWEISRSDLEHFVKRALAGDEGKITKVTEGLKANHRNTASWRIALTDAYADLLRAEAAGHALTAPMMILNAEYERRGGWTRAYLVQTHNGHVHSFRMCSTCNNGEQPTRFVWMTAYSGKTEAEIIADAGCRACTICYPNAPTEDLERPTKMFGPDEIERRKAAEQRAATRAAKEREAAVKGITLPDGSPLRDEAPTERFPHAGSIVKTLVTAKREMNYHLYWAESGGNSADRHEATVQHLARAIAWKTNGLPVGAEPTTEQIEEVIAPARAKKRKEIDKDTANGR